MAPNKPLARNRASRSGCADSQQPLARIWVSSFICGSQQTPGPETGLQDLDVSALNNHWPESEFQVFICGSQHTLCPKQGFKFIMFWLTTTIGPNLSICVSQQTLGPKQGFKFKMCWLSTTIGPNLMIEFHMWLSTNAWARNRASRFGTIGPNLSFNFFHMWLSTYPLPETGLQVYHVLARNNHWPESEFQVAYLFLNKPLARNRASSLGCVGSQQPLARI